VRPRIFALVDRDADEGLITAALDLGDTTVLSVSPSSSPMLQRALQRGATRALRVWDEALAESDFLGVAHVLGVAVRYLAQGSSAPFMVLAGDRGRGAVGAAVAERLMVPHLSAARRLTWRDDRLVAERCVGGMARCYAVPIPSVICLSETIDPPTLPTRVEPRSVEEWSLSNLHLPSHDLLFRKRFRPLPALGPQRCPRVVPDAAALVDQLRAEGLLGRLH
jgi:electron transfer flavoprotein alpha/beta subunit